MHGMHSKWHHKSSSLRRNKWTNSNKLGRHYSRFSTMLARKHSIGNTPGPNGREHWRPIFLKRLEDMNVSTVKPCLPQSNDAEVHFKNTRGAEKYAESLNSLLHRSII